MNCELSELTVEESAATAGGQWTVAFDEGQPADAVITGPAASSATTEGGDEVRTQLAGALGELVRELKFLKEARPLARAKRVGLAEGVGDYCRIVNGVIKRLTSDDVMARLSEVVFMGDVTSGTEKVEAGGIVQTFHGYAVQMAYARERMMEGLDDFRAWRYLKRIVEPGAQSYKVPRRFVKRRRPEVEEWPALVSVSVGLALKNISD